MRRRCRPFTIADAMILVAAAAIGLAFARAKIDHDFWMSSGPTKYVGLISGFLARVDVSLYSDQTAPATSGAAAADASTWSDGMFGGAARDGG